MSIVKIVNVPYSILFNFFQILFNFFSKSSSRKQIHNRENVNCQKIQCVIQFHTNFIQILLNFI